MQKRLKNFRRLCILLCVSMITSSCASPGMYTPDFTQPDIATLTREINVRHVILIDPNLTQGQKITELESTSLIARTEDGTTIDWNLVPQTNDRFISSIDTRNLGTLLDNDSSAALPRLVEGGRSFEPCRAVNAETNYVGEPANAVAALVCGEESFLVRVPLNSPHVEARRLLRTTGEIVAFDIGVSIHPEMGAPIAFVVRDGPADDQFLVIGDWNIFAAKD